MTSVIPFCPVCGKLEPITLYPIIVKDDKYMGWCADCIFEDIERNRTENESKQE